MTIEVPVHGLRGRIIIVVVDHPEQRTVRIEKRVQLLSALARSGLGDSRPVVVLVGGAEGFDKNDRARLRPLLERGLAPVVEALGACVVDGGTEAGVMALIGEARTLSGAQFPLIGVTAEGTATVTTDPKRPDGPPPFDRNHTHLLLVPGHRWGDEAPWLADVASKLAREHASVTVVINGGDVTLNDVGRSVDAARPVLVVAGSGRTADALAFALEHGSHDTRVSRLVSSGLLRAVDAGSGPSALARAVAATLTTEHIATSAPTSYHD